MNRTTFTILFALGAVGSLGLASACLDDLGALKPVDAGPLEEAAANTACGDSIVATLDDGGDAGEACDPGPPPSAVLGCTQACTISCGGVVGPSGHCYFLADPSDFATARENCASAGGHVVTIGSEDEARLVDSFADGGSYRVGMIVSVEEPAYVSTSSKDEGIEPGWPRSGRCSGCFAVLDASAGNEFPIGVDAGEHSCLVTTPGGWVQVPCSDTASYLTICEREPPGQRARYCGGPYCATVPATAGKKRYVISLEPASASEADAFCRTYEGGSLVILESRVEREQLAREIEELLGDVPPPLREVWIGLARGGEGWRWDDDAGAELADGGRPLPWAKDEPKPDGTGRAYLRFNTRFDTQLAATSPPQAPTDLKKRFVCQRSP